MKILLHACCGPCSIYPLKVLQEQGHQIRGYFYNPNIHPYTEYKKRLETFRDYAAKSGLPVIIDNRYELEEFLQEAALRQGERCRGCYEMRLRKAAEAAKAGGFEAYTTTLLVSPYQKHRLIKEIGEIIGHEAGIPFYYQDFRSGYREGAEKSREENMYRQKYCGCIFSERDRYLTSKR